MAFQASQLPRSCQASQLSNEMPPVDSVSGGFQTCFEFNSIKFGLYISAYQTGVRAAFKDEYSLEFYYMLFPHIAGSGIVWHINQCTGQAA